MCIIAVLMLIVNAEMGKAKQEMRARKSRRKVSCLNCDKTMSWEYFRYCLVPSVHIGKKVPVKVISKAEASAESSTQSVDIRNRYCVVSNCCEYTNLILFLIELSTVYQGVRTFPLLR